MVCDRINPQIGRERSFIAYCNTLLDFLSPSPFPHSLLVNGQIHKFCTHLMFCLFVDFLFVCMGIDKAQSLNLCFSSVAQQYQMY